MADKEEVIEGIDDGDEKSSDYKVLKKVAVSDLLNMDQQDESLKKYKESLLGQASTNVFSRKSFSFNFIKILSSLFWTISLIHYVSNLLF